MYQYLYTMKEIIETTSRQFRERQKIFLTWLIMDKRLL